VVCVSEGAFFAPALFSLTLLLFMFMSHFSAEKCVAIGSGARVSLAILFGLSVILTERLF